MRTPRKYIRTAAALAVAGGIVGAAFWPEAREVTVTRVVRGPMQASLEEDGRTRVRERFVVSAPVGGRLERVELDAGDCVKANQTVLARLYPAAAPLLDARTRAELTAAVDSAQALVAQAEAEKMRADVALARARTALGRQRELAAAGAIAPDALDAADADARVAEQAARAADFAALRAARDLKLARARLARPGTAAAPVLVTAPVDGAVLRVFHTSEAVVTAGEPLMEIGDPAALEIVADVLSTDAIHVRSGAPVMLDYGNAAHPLKGRVRRVEPSGFMKVSALGVEEQRVNVIVDLVGGNGDAPALGDGYRLDLRIVTWAADDAVKVATGALFRVADGWAAFVIEDGHARLRAVEIGHRTPIEAEVLSGLSPDDAVILHPPDSIADGGRVVAGPE